MYLLCYIVGSSNNSEYPSWDVACHTGVLPLRQAPLATLLCNLRAPHSSRLNLLSTRSKCFCVLPLPSAHTHICTEVKISSFPPSFVAAIFALCQSVGHVAVRLRAWLHRNFWQRPTQSAVQWLVPPNALLLAIVSVAQLAFVACYVLLATCYVCRLAT